MKDQNMQFPIPNEVLEPFIKQAVSTSIVAALGDGTKLVEQAVHAALSEKVTAQGERSRYSAENRFFYAEVVAKNKIREIAKECINEMAERMRPQIRQAIENSLKAQGGILAKALEEALMTSLSAQWGVSISLNTDSNSPV